MKYEHRVAVWVSTQVLMDIEAENDIDSIKREAIRSYQAGEGNQEEVMVIPQSMSLYPWLSEGQEPPKGSNYPDRTDVDIEIEELDVSKVTEAIWANQQ